MNRRNEPIRSWEDGDRVQGFALITRKEVREDRRGKTFVDLEVADESGTMSAKIWSDSPALGAEFEAHDFVALRGSVKSYRDQLQVSIDECRRATDEDRQYGFDEARLIPSTREDIGELWERLNRVLDEGVERPELRRLVAETLDAYGDQLKLHPAAKTMHHAYRGGLLEHVVSMAELARVLADHYGDLDRDLLLVGVLFHDLGKLRELGAMPANDYTLEGRLVGHVVIGRDLVLERCAAIPGFPADLQLLLEHLVLAHQGKREYASPVEPVTPEALVLHYLDDLDSKLNQFTRHRDEGPGLLWHRSLGRHVYLAPETATWEGDGAEPPADEPPAPEAAEVDAAEPAAPATGAEPAASAKSAEPAAPAKSAEPAHSEPPADPAPPAEPAGSEPPRPTGEDGPAKPPLGPTLFDP